MKQTPELDRIEARMRPGELTLHGFLGSDTRKLADILAQDAETARMIGLDFARAAERLAELTELGRDLAEREVDLDSRYSVAVRDDRGLIPSPWGDGVFEKGEVHLRDSVTGLEFRWNALTLHLLAAHGFCGGRGSLYRLAPEALAQAGLG